MYTKVQALCLQCYYNAIVNYFLDQTCIFVIKKLINLFLPRSFTLQLHLCYHLFTADEGIVLSTKISLVRAIGFIL